MRPLSFFAIFALAATLGCTAPLATEPAEAAHAPAAPIAAPLGADIDTDWLKNGKIRVLAPGLCDSIYGHYTISYGGCTAIAMLGDCTPAPGGTCDCTAMPLQQSPGCEGVSNGSGVFQWE